MGTMVQARLDQETQQTLDRLVREHGMSKSEILREGIRLVNLTKARRPASKSAKLIGAGKFDSGLGDLSTDPKYMEGFGKKWRNGKWDW